MSGEKSRKIYREIVQGTEQWLQARRGIITASIVGKLITSKTLKPAKGLTPLGIYRTLVAERITGRIEETPESWDMRRGKFEEPIARRIYSENYGEVTEVGIITDEFDGATIGYSPDGLVGDDGLIEIKSRTPKKHLQTILEGEVPTENIAQCQCGLLISGRKWLDYVSFCGGMPLYVCRVAPDMKWQTAIVEAAKIYEETAQQMMSEYFERVNGLPETEETGFDKEIWV